MCGIAGAVGASHPRMVEAMTRFLNHRGPDSFSVFQNQNTHIYMGVQRLSIIDLEGGTQPILNETRDKCVILNGEIFNYRELRRTLERKGHIFSSHSDTEVIIHLYEEYGEECVFYLEGMYAFAVADGARLFLARDPLGIKPLYYTNLKEENLFLFASEIKALLQCHLVKPSLNWQAFANHMAIGYPLGDETFVQDIRSIPAGHTLVVSPTNGAIRINERQYHRLEISPDESIELETAEDKLIDIMQDIVASHLIADVRVGITLSGGLDSTLLAFLMSKYYSKKISAFTVSDHEAYSDAVEAARIIKLIGAEGKENIINFESYMATIPDYIVSLETIPTLSSLPLYLLFREVSRSIKVCLNGEGADELFGGYPEYLNRDYKVGYIKKRLSVISNLGLHPSSSVADIVDRLSQPKEFEDYVIELFQINLNDQLVRRHLEVVDKCSMAFGVEVRVPFLDLALVRFVNSLPIRFKVNNSLGIQKYILKRVSLKLFGMNLAETVLRQKSGLPRSGSHCLMQFDAYCNDLLPPHYVEGHELGFCFSKKRELLLFELFQELFINQRAKVQDGFKLDEFIKERAGRAKLPKRTFPR